MQAELAIEKKWLQRTRIDNEAFEFFYRKYRPKIYKYVYMRILDRDLATDLTDETFSRAVDRLGSFEWQGYTFGAWLFKIARNVVGEDFRRRKARPEVAFHPESHERDSGCRPDLEVEELIDYKVLGSCIDRLKPAVKVIFVNHYGLGLTTREIAVDMRISESTVKSHLQRGRKCLQKCLLANGINRGIPRRCARERKERRVIDQ